MGVRSVGRHPGGGLMISEWDETAWAGEPVGKAATGYGVTMVTHRPYVIHGRDSLHSTMKQGQVAYHHDPWIRLAESTVTRRVVGLPWHLEEAGTDVEVPDTAAGVPGEVLKLLERPQANLSVRQPAVATWRGLAGLTSRHLGLCGMAHWYKDQRSAVNGMPLGFLYINPARMFPIEDEVGNLLLWSLDPRSFDGRGQPIGGMPIRLDEVITFYLDPPDSGNIGHGIYEAAVTKAGISRVADAHAGYVLASGGRIAGLVAPKEGRIDPKDMRQMAQEMMNVNDSPDAAKRTTILSGPIDWFPTAADPSELSLPDLSRMTRDDILAIWGVPPATAGIPAPAGLNSGGTREYDEAVLMQGSVHDRVRAIKEGIQYGLLDAIGIPLDFEVEEPEFDDRTPLFVLAEKAKDLPLRNKERRELIGLPPFGEDGRQDPRDEEVWMPTTFTKVYEASGEPVAPPEPEPQEPPIGVLRDVGFRPPVQAKASLPGLRASIEKDRVPSLLRSVVDVLQDQRHQVIGKLRSISEAVYKRHRNDADFWYDSRKGEERWRSVLIPAAVQTGEVTVKGASKILSRPGKAEPWVDDVMDSLRSTTGERIVDINTATRDIIAKTIQHGFEQGMSPLALAEALEETGTFPGLGDESILARAERIARTETMFAYNHAALGTYRDGFGVERVQAIDGDTDGECAERNGKEFPVTEAFGIYDHPNGTLDWIPVL